MVANDPAHQTLIGVLRTLLLSGILLQSIPLAVSSAAVTSAITSDGTLGTAIVQSGPDYAIQGGTLQGANLFHSFGQFSVGTGDSATFTGPAGVTNILSRVTGGQPSAIDGRLRSEIVGANLYLLNPSGVLFGPNASLDVQGSFHVSTADFLRFADGAQFFATMGQESMLTVAAPAAFGFLGSTPAPITIEGSALRVREGQALSVVGGDVQIMSARLMAPSGRIQTASTASPGEVMFNPLELAPDLRVDGFARLGRLELSQGALLNVSGNGGGTVLLRSGQLLVDQSFVLAENTGSVNGAGLGMDLQVTADAVIANGSLLTTDSFGSGRARDLRLTAGSVHVDDAVIASRSFLGNSGDAGSLGVRAGRVTLTGGAQFYSTTFGSGRGGDVTVAATDAMTLAGGSGIGSVAEGSGNGGNVTVSAGELTFTGGSGIVSLAEGSGNGGNVTVSAGELTLAGGSAIGSRAKDSGNGGNVTISAGELTFTGGSGIVSLAEGSGNGGNITVSARDSMSLSGGAGAEGGIVSGTTASSHGNAGAIHVEAGTLTLTGGTLIGSLTQGSGNGGEITVSARQSVSLSGTNDAPTGIVTFAAGNPGRLSLSAPAVNIDGGIVGTPSASLGEFVGGRGGDTIVQADNLTLSGGGQITSRTLTDSDGGRITIEARRLTISGGARIDSGTEGGGRGGAVTVMATEAISISGRGQAGNRSGLFSNTFGLGDAGQLSISTPLLTMDEGLIQANAAQGSRGNAGNIDVRVERLALSGGAQLSTSTFGSGRGGNIIVTAAEQVELSTGGTISSSSTSQGNAGSIVIQAGKLFRSQNGAVTTEAEQADGGNIQLTAGSLVDLRDSRITATVKGGEGKGGNIMIGSQSVILEGSQIRADAFGGPGGNVGIVSGVFLADPASRVSASSTVGVQGTVDIRAPVTSLSGALAPLPQAFVSAAALLPTRCAARFSGGTTSSLVLSGREGLPPDPASMLPSPLILGERLAADPAAVEEPRPHQSSRGALLTVAEKVLPRLRDGMPQGGHSGLWSGAAPGTGGHTHRSTCM